MLLLSLALIAACSSPPEVPERIVEPRPFTETAPRGTARMQAVMMTIHNGARASARVAALAWDDTLAGDAEGYARELARQGKFEHSKQPRGNPPQGENLWTGTRGAYRYEEMAQHWIDERRYFVNGAVPNASKTGKFADVGHYTQIIWRSTTRVGCGFARNGEDDYLVCRYAPAGNIWGEKALL